jgi:glycosyltransferase involved in cell wall biosynthesis
VRRGLDKGPQTGSRTFYHCHDDSRCCRYDACCARGLWLGDDVRIAFDHQIFSLQRHGGVSRAHARLAGEMAAAGNDVRVCAPLHINAYLGDLPPDIAPGRRVAATSNGGRAARLVSGMAARPLLAGFRPDIVQETYYAPRRTAPARARVVVMVYDMIHEKFRESFPADDTTAAMKAVAVARADHVLCISQSTRADLIEAMPAAAAKSSVLLLGFDPVLAGVEPAVAARPYLLFVGQRGGYKNFSGLLDAYAASPVLRAEFDLLAVGGGGFTPGECAAIALHGLSGQVRQQAADDMMLQRCYAGASVFVYPSLYEGFGIPPLEAMAAGTPVVAMRISSVPEVCGPAAVYAEPGDPDSLRRAIESVALSPQTAAALAAEGRRRIGLFSWARAAAEAVATYRTLL